MVEAKNSAQREATRWFGEELRAAMRRAGHTSDRSRSGIDPGPLAKLLKVTYEMGRRYVEGIALPKSAKRRSIERWLRLPEYSLEPPEHKAERVRTYRSEPETIKSEEPHLIEEPRPPAEHTYGYDMNLLAECARAVTEVLFEQDIELDREQAAQVISRLYQEALDAERQGKEPDTDDKSVFKLVIDVLKGG